MANNVVANIVSHDYFFNFSKLGKLLEHLLIEIFEVFNCGDQVFIGDVAAIRVRNCSLRVLVHVLKNERLRKVRLIVQARAGVSVTTRPNFVIKWTIYSKNIKTWLELLKSGEIKLEKGEKNTYLSSSVPIIFANRSAMFTLY